MLHGCAAGVVGRSHLCVTRMAVFTRCFSAVHCSFASLLDRRRRRLLPSRRCSSLHSLVASPLLRRHSPPLPSSLPPLVPMASQLLCRASRARHTPAVLPSLTAIASLHACTVSSVMGRCTGVVAAASAPSRSLHVSAACLADPPKAAGKKKKEAVAQGPMVVPSQSNNRRERGRADGEATGTAGCVVLRSIAHRASRRTAPLPPRCAPFALARSSCRSLLLLFSLDVSVRVCSHQRVEGVQGPRR